MYWQIAIDGPAGAGKSTIAKEVAKRLNFTYVDTGAMYRAVTLKALNLNINMEDEAEYDFLQSTKIDFKNNHIYLDEVDVSNEIRSLDVTNNVSLVSKFKYVRDTLVALQQSLAKSKNIIMDGRDIGTVVLPKANLKIFLVASVAERAARRLKERQASGNFNISLDETIAEIEQRDFKDSNRAISPLAKATDAIEIDTSLLSVNEVVDKIIRLVMERGYKMENVKTEVNVETSVAEATENKNVKEEVQEEVQEEIINEEANADIVDENTEAEESADAPQVDSVRELQLVEGTVVKVDDAAEERKNKEGKVVRKAHEERVLIKLANGQEGYLFRKDVADIKDDETLNELYLEGDQVKVIVKRVYPDGGLLFSTALIAKRENIKKFDAVIKEHGTFMAKVVKSIKVGLLLEYEDYTCLLPNSQIDIEEDKLANLIGTELEVAPIRIDYNRIRLIVSHKVAKAIRSRTEKQEFIKTVEVGQVFDGVVKNIESYGAFVELAPGVEGLLHISEIEHNRIVKVEKVLNIGDTVKVQVIKVDKDHIGLSRKALLPNYWKEFIDAHKVDDLVTGKIIEINNAGIVVALSDEIQGFLPKSEFAWEKDTFIEDFVKVGEDIESKIIELDLNKKRIILSKKKLVENPWEALKLKSGDSVKAVVVKVMAEGVKVNVEGAFGFMPKNNYQAGTVFTEGQELEAKVRVFDPIKTRLVITMKEDKSLDKNSINKYLKSQERVTSTFGDFINLDDFKKSKK